MDTAEHEDTGTTDADAPTELAVHTLLQRVADKTRERPLVALAVAGGAGLVLARGLPRVGMLALLGITGAVGYAIVRARN